MPVTGDDLEGPGRKPPEHLILTAVHDVQIAVRSDRKAVGSLQRNADGRRRGTTARRICATRCTAGAPESEVRDQPNRRRDGQRNTPHRALAPLAAPRILGHARIDRALG